MNAFFLLTEATRLHETTAPSSGRKLKYPDTGTEGTVGGWGWSVHIRHLTCTHRWGLTRPTRQRGQINMSDTAQSRLLKINGYRSIPINPLQKKKKKKKRPFFFLNIVRISKRMALLTRIIHTSKQNLWNKNTCTEMEKKKKLKQPFFSFRITNFIQFCFFFRVTVSKHKSVYCAKKTNKKKVNHTMTRCPRNINKTLVQYWGLGGGCSSPPPPRPLPIIQEVSQGN